MINRWWLLALCGVLDAILALLNLSMQDPDGSLTWRIFVPMSTGMLMCRLAVAAGACTIAAGIWRSREGKSWLLVLNGLAFSAYGLIPMIFSTRPLSFRLFAFLLVVMAMSIGILELATARTLRRHVADKWFLRNMTPQGSRGCQLQNTDAHCHHHEQEREKTKAKWTCRKNHGDQSVGAKSKAIQHQKPGLALSGSPNAGGDGASSCRHCEPTHQHTRAHRHEYTPSQRTIRVLHRKV